MQDMVSRTASFLCTVQWTTMFFWRTLSRTAKCATDASSTGAGAVLMNDNGVWRLLFLCSKNFSPAQRKYSTVSREPAAFYLAVKHYHHYFKASPDIVLYCDYQPFVHALYSPTERVNARDARQLAFTAKYASSLKILRGVRNVVADALIRFEITQFSVTPPTLTGMNSPSPNSKIPLSRIWLHIPCGENIEHCEWQGAKLWCSYLIMANIVHLFRADSANSLIKYTISIIPGLEQRINKLLQFTHGRICIRTVMHAATGSCRGLWSVCIDFNKLIMYIA